VFSPSEGLLVDCASAIAASAIAASAVAQTFCFIVAKSAPVRRATPVKSGGDKTCAMGPMTPRSVERISSSLGRR
jgi:hypothetical protein